MMMIYDSSSCADGMVCGVQSRVLNLVIFEEAVKELGRILKLGLAHLPIVVDLHSRLVPSHLQVIHTSYFLILIQHAHMYICL